MRSMAVQGPPPGPQMKPRRIQILNPEVSSPPNGLAPLKEENGPGIFYLVLLFLAFLFSLAALYLVRQAP